MRHSKVATSTLDEAAKEVAESVEIDAHIKLESELPPLLQHGAIDNATTQVTGRLAMSHEYQFQHTEYPSDIKYADLDQSTGEL